MQSQIMVPSTFARH